MNYGGYVIRQNFLSVEEINKLKTLALALVNKSTATHETGKYASKLWSFIPLLTKDGKIPDDVNCPELNKIVSFFQTSLSLAVFYYLEPGGKLHPHRDLTGAKLNDRIRFHIPIQTNSEVVFKVSNERLLMNPGDLWALDTSYLHSVENNGGEVRIHAVFECDVNDWCKGILKKKNLHTFAHDIFYFFYLVFAVSKSLLVNTWKDPRYLQAQIKMGMGFIRWRIISRLVRKH